ncbi:MAG: helix-turn-helix domain-containing protein [Bacteroidetes bacterium]|nr:helix-turn-helix domain-containing protein [Bacteroidota bacterium]
MEKLNFQTEIVFSQAHSTKRIQKANKLLGEKAVNRIIALAMFFLGGKREHIGKFINMPIGTFYSFLNRFHSIGTMALTDQREKPAKQLIEPSVETPASIEAGSTHPGLEIVFGEKKHFLSIPQENKLVINPSNRLQYKMLILSFLNSGFLTVKEAGARLGISERHVRDIGKSLLENDVESLIDKRKGQQKDYIVTENVKAEIIQQYAANLVGGKSTAGNAIATQVNNACSTSLSERAIRQHISKLGLNKIKKSLPELLKSVKKSSKS